VTSCFTDSNSSQKRKIHRDVNARHFTLQNPKFYLDPPQTEALDLSNKFKPASWYTTDSSGHSVYVSTNYYGGGVSTVRTPANHLPNGSTGGTHHTGVTSVNDT